MISFINIRKSYAERDVFTALEARSAALFWRDLFIYACILVGSIPVVGSFGWIKSQLELLWRDWLTRRLLSRYLANRNFTRIPASEVDNPDERIQQDIASFCTETLTIAMAVADSTLAFFSFVTILYLISPTLLVVAVAYAIAGTVATLMFGKRLIGMHYEQQRLEAEFRYNLVYLRDNAEAIGLYNAGERESKGLLQRFGCVLKNMYSIVSWQRNMTLFKTSYDYGVLIIPSLISAPLYLAGQIELGMIVQAATAFGTVVGALSIVVGQYQTYARLGAIARRISDFIGKLEQLENQAAQSEMTALEHNATGAPECQATAAAAIATSNGIKTRVTAGGRLVISNLSMTTPDRSHSLVQGLNLELKLGARLIIAGPSGVGKSSLLRAVAGLWLDGSGLIERPDLSDMMVLPQESYMPLGTLRDQLTYPLSAEETGISDARIIDVLKRVDLAELSLRVGGLNAVKTWSEILSPGERQRVAFARLLLATPKLVLLDEATSALDADNERKMYEFVTTCGATVVSVAHHQALIAYHDTVLVLEHGGGWRLVEADEYLASLRKD